MRYYLREKQALKSISRAVIKHSISKLKHMTTYDETSIMRGLPTKIINQLISIRYADAIRAIKLFRYIPNQSIVLHIFRTMIPHFFEAGSFILKEKESARYIYFMVTGSAQLLKLRKRSLREGKCRGRREGVWVKNGAGTAYVMKEQSNDGELNVVQDKHVMLEQVTRGDILGHVAAMREENYSVSARASTPCSAYALSMADVLQLSNDSLAVRLALQTALSAAMREKKASSYRKRITRERTAFIKEIRALYLAVVANRPKKTKLPSNTIDSGPRSPSSTLIQVGKALTGFMFSRSDYSFTEEEKTPTPQASPKEHSYKYLSQQLLRPPTVQAYSPSVSGRSKHSSDSRIDASEEKIPSNLRGLSPISKIQKSKIIQNSTKESRWNIVRTAVLHHVGSTSVHDITLKKKWNRILMDRRAALGITSPSEVTISLSNSPSMSSIAVKRENTFSRLRDVVVKATKASKHVPIILDESKFVNTDEDISQYLQVKLTFRRISSCPLLSLHRYGKTAVEKKSIRRFSCPSSVRLQANNKAAVI